MDLSLCWTTTPKGVLLVKLIEPPLAEPHERWCERSKIALKEEFSPTRLAFLYFCKIRLTYGIICAILTLQTLTL